MHYFSKKRLKRFLVNPGTQFKKGPFNINIILPYTAGKRVN